MEEQIAEEQVIDAIVTPIIRDKAYLILHYFAEGKKRQQAFPFALSDLSENILAYQASKTSLDKCAEKLVSRMTYQGARMRDVRVQNSSPPMAYTARKRIERAIKQAYYSNNAVISEEIESEVPDFAFT